MKVLLTAACMHAVSSVYGVPEPDLWALMAQERGRVGEVVQNKNATYDIGPFQINSSWVPTFTRLWRLPDNEATLSALRDNGCWNAAAAGVIYQHSLTEAKGDRHAALGFYHSHTPHLAESYVAQLDGKYQKLFGLPAFQASAGNPQDVQRGAK